jgi:spore coat polysaccharide biosynthesis predicted glycosyltransferase SpsG
VGRALSRRLLTVVASASRGEGRGHLARALAIAEAAAELPVPCAIALLRGEPTAAERGRAQAAGAAFVGPATARGIPGAEAALVVVDLPDPNEAGRAVLARATVFDDRQLLASPARVVVQPSLPSWTPAPGAAAGRALVGYAYAPLGRSVLDAVARRPARGTGPVPRVLICFGGSDPHDVTARLGAAIAADARWSLDLVVGPDYRGAAEADGLAVLREPPDLAELLAAADVAILGAGTMKFEAAALGTPAILVAAAEDQVPVGPPFAATGAAAWAGDGRDMDPSGLVELLAALVLDPDRRAEMARRGPAVVPGDGARRIVAATMADTGTEGAA